MPKAPVLPQIDWKTIYESGLPFAGWLEACEDSERREKMQAQAAAQGLPQKIEARLAGLTRPVYVVAIAEDWCPDVLRHVPVLERYARAPALAVRYIAREQHLDVLARFLTNGGEAIPKFIFLNDEFVECANWGPMPEVCRTVIARGRACGDLKAAREKVSRMYEMDADCGEVARELFVCIDIASSTAP